MGFYRSNDPTNSVEALKEGSSDPKDQTSIPPGPPHHVTIMQDTIYSDTQSNTHTQMNLSTVKWAQ